RLRRRQRRAARRGAAGRRAGTRGESGCAMSRWAGAAALLVLVSAALTCRESTGPVAGMLKVDLTTPNSGGDGAILLTVTGPAVLTSATTGTVLRLFAHPHGATTRFTLTGPLGPGTV